MSDDIDFLGTRSVGELADRIRAREISACAALEEAIVRVERMDGEINAVCHRDFEMARKHAAELDDRIRNGEDVGPLAGVPLGVKDLEDARGMPTRLGSLFHKDASPAERDSPHVERLRAAGAIPFVKTNTAEFGFAGNCASRLCGTTRNPWDLSKTPGGSSGGSAAAVAAGMIPLCTGGDGGGSLRGPAAFCGLVGFKASQGRVPTPDGLAEHTGYGVLTTNVSDMALCLDVMAGPHSRDRMTLPQPDCSYLESIESTEVAGLRAAWSGDLGFAVVDPEVEQICRVAAERLICQAGLHEAKVEVSFPNVMEAIGALYVDKIERKLTCAGILPDRRGDLSPEVQCCLDTFRPRDPCHLLEMQGNLGEALRISGELYRSIDFLLSPTTAVPAFAAEGPAPDRIAGRDARRTQDAPLTPLANYAWNPSISVPAGMTSNGLPVGLMITGPRHRDDLVLRLARIFEQENPWPRHPKSLEIVG